MSDKLIYQPRHFHQIIDRTRQQIRLIKLNRDIDAHGNICCQTSVYDLDNAPVFRAISYEWGSATPPRYIMVDNHLLVISENLWRFLEMFRLQVGNKDWLWIDQISIDQSNLYERTHQVKMMGSIYSTAAAVIAWLGRCSGDQTKHLEDVIYHQGQYHLSLKFLFEYKYWTRLWIIQELSLSKKVQFYAGSTLLEPHILALVFNFFLEQNMRAYEGDLSAQRYRWALDAHMGCHIENLLRMTRVDYPQSLAVVLGRVGSVGQCSEPRDLIFGLFGLVDNSHSIQIDYSVSTETLMEDVLETVIYSRIKTQIGDDLEGLSFALKSLTRKLGLPEQWKVWLGGNPLEFDGTLQFLGFINMPWAAQFDRSKWSVDQLMMIYREARTMFPPSKVSGGYYTKYTHDTADARLGD